ncbi:MAG: Ig-like domain-containing protein [bacterium]|nr:Ig-like domain-containing protein [bacterium]
MGLTFPILLSATDGAGTVLYSWADAEGDIANITPLTTLALLLSSLADNLGGVFANWAPSSAQLDEAGMLAAQAIVNANLQSLFTDAGVDYTEYDFLTTPFSADGSGIDGMLDALHVSFDFLGGDLNSVVTITLAEDGTPILLDPDIDISDITFARTLAAIAVTPASTSVAVASASQFTATGSYSDGSTSDITSSVTWTSGTPTVAIINAATGLATGIAAGVTTITAASGRFPTTRS